MIESAQPHHSLITRLDIADFLNTFRTYFARDKSFIPQGDRIFYAQILQELDNLPISPPPQIQNLDTAFLHLQKYGTLSLDTIFTFMQIVRYFLYLKTRITESTHTKIWLDKILIPRSICDMVQIFDENGELKIGIYPHIDALQIQLKQNKMHINAQINAILHTNTVTPYLVDKSVHYVNENECLLLKAGYHHAIKGVVIQRSQNGFFYLVPDSIIALKERQDTLKETLQEQLYTLCQTLSETLHKHLSFLRFLNHAFDTFDHIYARLSFAKAYNLSFMYEISKQKDIILRDFSHPALAKPKPINIHFYGDVLMITGVNAGGKTILLKSLLAACFLTKYLIPFKINPHHSQIPYFKHIIAIISDPQSSKNDISTFAGRMLELKHVLSLQNLLLGIDEVELGTDADEAASLYKVLLEHLMKQKAKILLTTHHKHLAAIMAHNPQVQLCAAMYDVEREMPLFSFLDGSIGKSYAFESAKRYGIPATLINEAKAVYGKDKERLNELIERSSALEIALEKERENLKRKIEEYDKKILSLKADEEAQKLAFDTLKNELESTYHQAKLTLTTALKTQESKQMHKALNKAHKILSHLPIKPQETTKAFTVGTYVKYKNSKGKILKIKDDMCIIELESGFRVKEKMQSLRASPVTFHTHHTTKTNISFQQPKSAGVSLDLHGMRGEEALEKLDEFISAALVAGYDEILVYHGIGRGILSKLVAEYLKSHPKVISFSDAPAQMGGFGAKIIKL